MGQRHETLVVAIEVRGKALEDIVDVGITFIHKNILVHYEIKRNLVIQNIAAKEAAEKITGIGDHFENIQVGNPETVSGTIKDVIVVNVDDHVAIRKKDMHCKAEWRIKNKWFAYALEEVVANGKIEEIDISVETNNSTIDVVQEVLENH